MAKKLIIILSLTSVALSSSDQETNRVNPEKQYFSRGPEHGVGTGLNPKIGHGITPLFVKTKQDVFKLNICWFIPATLGSLIALFKIRKSHPDVPPSRSAFLQRQRYIFELFSLVLRIIE